MIVHPPVSFFSLLFTLRLSVVARIWPRLLVVTAIALGVTLAYSRGFEFTPLTVTPFSLIGVVLSIFLGFRTNASYDRFWEARKLWGRLVNCTRTMTLQTELYVRRAGEPGGLARFREEQARTLIAYVHAFRGMLRRTSVDGDLRRLVHPSVVETMKQRRNPPLALLQRMSQAISSAWRSGWVDDYNVKRLEQSLEELLSIQGGCERILNTPLPFSYRFYIHRITAIYCFLLPFGIVEVVGIHTPLVTLGISADFLGLDAIGTEIENPFGSEPNDLPLNALSRNIEIDVLQLIGLSDVPRPLEPVNHILM